MNVCVCVRLCSYVGVTNNLKEASSKLEEILVRKITATKNRNDRLSYIQHSGAPPAGWVEYWINILIKSLFYLCAK